mmetsp:Transcript_28516/g.62212  ORF Transcript_28516/g.62212 Transcript_28516/m.62212 type:complete len:303 (-) Transcript_28516:49-957(-)
MVRGLSALHAALALCVLAFPSTSISDVEAAKPFKATFAVSSLSDGSSGKFTVEVHPDWAPLGAARFAELIQAKFFDQVRFFRAIHDFMAQFGISGDPATSSIWRSKEIKDDPNKVKNLRYRLTFATAGPGTRTTQIFINFKDNTFLDSQGFSPFAEVVEGMEVVDKIYQGYGEGAPQGRGPDQGIIQAKGNAYLEKDFPKLSVIDSVTAVDTLPTIEAILAGGNSGGVMTADDMVAKGPNSLLIVLGIVAFAVCGIGLWMLSTRSAKDSQGPTDGRDLEAEELTVPGSGEVARKRGQAGVAE